MTRHDRPEGRSSDGVGTQTQDTGGHRQIPVRLIDPDPSQPRHIFDEKAVGDLAASIAEHGLLQPIGVRHADGNRYVIVFGERRFRAVSSLGWSTVPAVELSRDNAAEVLTVQLVENMARVDLGPLEQARAFQRLIDAGMAGREVAEAIGRTPSYVSHKLSLLATPGAVQVLLDDDVLTEGHVRQLLRLRSWSPPDVTEGPWDVPEADDPHDLLLICWIAGRPLDVPLTYFGFPQRDDENIDAVHQAAVAWCRELSRDKWPPWHRLVSWYALAVAVFGLTVSDTRKVIDRHREHIAAAAAWLRLEPTGEHRFGYKSDLRHAGYDQTTHEALGDIWLMVSPNGPSESDFDRWPSAHTARLVAGEVKS